MEKILKELVEIPSVTEDKKNCTRIVSFVEKCFKEKELNTQILEKNGVFTLIAGKKLTKNPKIILNGHLDVVPAPKEMFKTKTEGSKMFGRGTSDMKSGCVAEILAFTELLEEGLNPDCLIVFTTDEEEGGFNGIKNFLEQGFRSEIVFTPDGGDDTELCTDEKGVFHFLLKAKGKSAHGSRPWRGENAIQKLIKVFQQLEREFEERWGKSTEEDNWKPTLNLGMLEGGSVANQVPNRAEMKVDIRFPSPVTLEEVKSIVSDCLRGKSGIFMETLSTGSPLSTNVENPFVKSWIEIFGRKVKFVKESGASDARFFAEKGIPVILTKPKASEPHIDDEWIDLKSLKEFKDVLKEWLKVNG